MIKYQLWTRIIQPAIYFRWKGFTSSLQYQGLAFHSIIYKTLLTAFEPTESGEVPDRPEYKKVHDEYRNLVSLL